jgi:hypothetical protein
MAVRLKAATLALLLFASLILPGTNLCFAADQKNEQKTDKATDGKQDTSKSEPTTDSNADHSTSQVPTQKAVEKNLQSNPDPNPDKPRKSFTTGSDFKTGPVTDDEKLIKPVAKDAKNPIDANSTKLKPNDASESTDTDKSTGKNKNADQDKTTDKHKRSDQDKNPGTNTTTEKTDNQPAQSGQTSETSPSSDSHTGSSSPADKLVKPAPTAPEDANSTTPKKNFNVTINDKGPISIGATKVAKDLDMLDAIAELNDLKRTRAYVPGRHVHSLEAISVRQDLDETMLSAFLSTRRVISELDRQISGYDAVARVLEEKRDQAIRYNNILNFTSGGALAMTQGAISIGTPMKYQNAGNELGAIAGALTFLIGAYALKLQGGAKRDSEKDPNMLAPIFGLVPAEPNKYPPNIWNYLNDFEPAQKKTRREQLIARWIKLNYIEPLNKPSSKKHLQELAGTIPLHKVVNIDLLRDRIPMLEDVRAAVAGVNEYLDEIMTFVRKP